MFKAKGHKGGKFRYLGATEGIRLASRVSRYNGRGERKRNRQMKNIL